MGSDLLGYYYYNLRSDRLAFRQAQGLANAPLLGGSPVREEPCHSAAHA